MNERLLKDLNEVRHLSARFPRWRADQNRVINVEVPPSQVGVFTDREAAIYVARLHAILLPLTNLIIELKARLDDHIAMTKEMTSGKA